MMVIWVDSMGIILASQSPRRKELLSYLVKQFEVIPSNIEENIPKGIKVSKIPEYLSKIKAVDIAEKYPEDTVIGADTCVILGNKILGKPKDKDDAFKMLSLLSGKKHKVITGCTVIKNKTLSSFSVTSTVKFCKITNSEIEEYIATKEPYDKAGSYAIQGKGGAFVLSIVGDYFNIVGLPIATLKQYL